jgi:hypothetical protein
MTASYQRSVFINCPFDEEYAPLLRAIVFAIVDCGFAPRCALERSDASEIRIQKIYRVIGECALGVHDLSRTQLDARTQLPRFNMPLEMGIFLGAKFLGEGEQRQKACLVFDEQPFRYQTYLSDVAGQDIDWHGNDPRNVIHRVRDWLASLGEDHLPSWSIVWDHYSTFQGELRHRCSELKQRPEELTYTDVLRHITSFRGAYSETLDIRGEQTVSNPTAQDIRLAIKSIRMTDANPFVVLGKGASGFTYIQAILEADFAWTVEYQDGHLDQHFTTVRNLSTEDVVRLLIAYAEAGESWRETADWELVEI